jgi:hypothetical protein
MNTGPTPAGAPLPRTPCSRYSETPRTDAALDKDWTILDESLENAAKVSKELERENKTLWMAGYSARYILDDLNNEPGMWQIARLTGLPMGVIVEAFANIFAGADDSSENTQAQPRQ